MATTAEQVFIQAMALADEMTDTINVVNASDTASYRARTPGILTLLQAELVKQGDVYSTFEYTHTPLEPLGGLESGFGVIQYTGVEELIVREGTAYAYSIGVDGEGTVYVEDTADGVVWNVLDTISATDPTYRSFTVYNGVVTPTAGATHTRFRLAGTYEYAVTNYALFPSPIKEARIPDYAPWMKVQLPADLKSIDQVVNEVGEGYTVESYIKWENQRDLYIEYTHAGTVRINYRPIPAVVATMEDTLQLDDVACRTLLPYALCAELFKEENEGIARPCLVRFKELKAVASRSKPVPSQVMVDVYGGF